MERRKELARGICIGLKRNTVNSNRLSTNYLLFILPGGDLAKLSNRISFKTGEEFIWFCDPDFVYSKLHYFANKSNKRLLDLIIKKETK